MALSRALLFSVAIPLANIAAIDAGAFIATGLDHGFTSQLANRSLAIIGKQLTFGGALVFAIMAGLTFVAWALTRRSRSRSRTVRMAMLGTAALVAALAPLAIAAFVFDSRIGQLIPLLISGAAVALAAGAAPSAPTPAPASNIGVPLRRSSFGRRNVS